MAIKRMLLAVVWILCASARADQLYVGANLDGFNYYTNQTAYQNLARYLDDRGVTYAVGYLDGDYRVSYTGMGDLAFQMGAGTSYDSTRVGDRVVGTLRLRHDSPNVGGILSVSSSTGSLPSDLQILRPETTPDSNGVWSAAWLRATAPFKASYRYMDWGQTNGNPLVNWSDRPLVTDRSRVTGKGIPVEEMILFSNVQYASRSWMNIPVGATLDYTRSEATLIGNMLTSGVADMEYSNELWNFGFSQAADNLNAARSDSRYTRTDDFGRAAQRSADMAARHYLEWKTGAGSRAGRLKWGGFVASQYWNATGLEWIRDHYPDLLPLVDLAIAPYVPGNPSDIGGDSGTAEQLIGRSRAFKDTWLRQALIDTRSTALSFGVGWDTYEVSVLGGLTGTENEAEKRRAQTLADAGVLTRETIELLDSLGYKSFNQFGVVTPWSQFGYWGPTDSVYDLTGPRYTFLTPEPSSVVVCIVAMVLCLGRPYR